MPHHYLPSETISFPRITVTQYADLSLLIAARNNDVEKLAILVHHGNCNVNQVDARGHSPLVTAAYMGHLQCLKLLLSSKAISVNQMADNGSSAFSALMAACARNHTECIDALLERGDLEVNAVSPNDGKTAIHVAAQHGSYESLLKLYNHHRTDIHISTYDNNTLLHSACSDSDNIEGRSNCVTELLKLNIVDKNARNNRGETALWLAARNGCSKLLEKLLIARCDPNIPATDGTTPLWAAVQSGNAECFTLLMTCCATVDVSDSLQSNILAAGIINETSDIVGQILKSGIKISYNYKLKQLSSQSLPGFLYTHCKRYCQFSRLFMNPEAQHQLKNIKQYRTTALHLAAQHSPEIISMLLKEGLDIDAQDSLGLTPLHIAILYEQLESAKLLLSSGAKVNISTSAGESPFFLAACRYTHQKLSNAYSTATDDPAASFEHQARFLTLLIDKGANINEQDEAGNTLLHYASFKNEVPLMRILLEHGASPTIRNNAGESPLTLLLSSTTNPETYDLLLNQDQGAEINSSDKCGNTPLLLALEYAYIIMSSAASAVSYTPLRNLVDKGDLYDMPRLQADSLEPLPPNSYLNLAWKFLKNGADINATNDRNVTALYTAAALGNPELVMHLMENNATASNKLSPLFAAALSPLVPYCDPGDACLKALIEATPSCINAERGDGAHLLHVIAAAGKSEILELLIRKGAKINHQRSSDKSTALYLAAYHGHLECVRLLLINKAKVDKTRTDGSSPLHAAAANGHLDCLNELLRHKAHAGQTNNAGETPLLLATQHGHIACMSSLIQAAPETINKKCLNGTNPLTAAIAANRNACIDVLISTPGINLNAQGKEGTTLLHHAVLQGNVERVKALLKSGASTTARQKDGTTPLLLAAESGHAEVLRLLVKQDASQINTWRSTTKIRPLHAAAMGGHTECLQILISNGAQLNRSAKQGETPLFLAAHGGHSDCVEALLLARANVNKSTDNGCTPLCAAAMQGHEECLRKLLIAQADLNKADNLGNTPLFYATNMNHTGCVYALKEAAAHDS